MNICDHLSPRIMDKPLLLLDETKIRLLSFAMRKQPSRGVLKKGCSENVLQICRRISMSRVISITLLYNFIENAIWHGCSPVNLLDIARTSFYDYTHGGLLVVHRISCIINDINSKFFFSFDIHTITGNLWATLSKRLSCRACTIDIDIYI